MQIPTKALADGFSMPVYGAGTWLIGGKRDIDTSRDEEEIATLKYAIDQGVKHFDTAEGYAKGHSEEILGRAIKGYDRKKLLIATKVGGENQSYDNLIRSAHASLTRLGVSYIDLYMLHSYPIPGIPINEAMTALDHLVDEGLVRNIGVSNMTPRRFEEAQKYTKNKIVCNQVHYNTQIREAEVSGVLEHCQAHDVMLSAWRPLQKGAIAESKLIDEMAKKYGKTVNQVLLNWLISQQKVTVIAKTSSKEHLKENLGAVDWMLEAEDVAKIRKNFPDQKKISDTYPLDYPGDLTA